MRRSSAVWMGLVVVALCVVALFVGTLVPLGGAPPIEGGGAPASVSGTVPADQPLSVPPPAVQAPWGLRATAWQGQVNLTWEPSNTTDIDGYTVRTGREGVSFSVGAAETTYSYTVPSWDVMTLETASVVADRGTEVSAPSNTVQVRVAEEQAPTIEIHNPVHMASLAKSDVSLSWTIAEEGSGLDSGLWIVSGAGPYNGGPVEAGTVTHIYNGYFNEGWHNLTVTVSDLAGNNATVTHQFYVDATPPTITIIAPSTDPWFFSGNVVMSWTGSDAPRGVDYYKVYFNGVYALTTRSTTISSYLVPFGQGNITLTVEAYDLAGLRSNDTVTLVKDTIKPVLTVDAPDEGQALASGTVELWWNATDANLDRYQVSYDGLIYNDVPTNHLTLTLAEGNHSVWVKAWDLAGNAVVVKRNFTVDLTAPTVALDLSGTVFTNDEGAFLIEWDGSDALSGIDHYTLRYGLTEVYSGAATSSSVDITEEGTYWVQVTAYDRAGRSASDSFTLIVDRTLPTVSITTPANNTLVTATTASPVWDGDDDRGIDHYEVSLNGDDFQEVGMSTTETFELVEGTNIIRVKAVDLAGNERIACLYLVADLAPPTVWFVSPEDGAITASDVVSWSGSDSGTGIAKYEMRINGADWFNLGLATTADLGLPSDDGYIVMLRAYDEAGRVSEVVTLNINLDTTSPTVSIIEPFSTLLNEDRYEMLWSISEDFLDHYEVWVDDGTRTMVSSGAFTFTGLSDGSHVFHVLALDKAGHTGEDSLTVVVDTTDPSLELLAPEDGSCTNVATLSLSWSASDASGIDRFTVSVDGASPYVLAPTVTQYSVPSAAGGHTVVLTAYDEAGHSTVVLVHVVIDLTAPEVEVLTPLSGLTNNEINVTWEAWDENGVDKVLLRVDGGEWQQATNGTVLELADGEHLIEVKAFDPVGNNATDSVTITLDTVAPEVSSRSPAGSSASPDDGFELSFSEVMDHDTVTVVMTEVSVVKGWDGNVLVFVPSAGLTAGASYTIYVNGTDLAGNALNYVWSFTVQEVEDQEEGDGTLSGRVLDENGNPIAGAQVTLTNGTFTATNYTDANGFVSLEAPVGSYTLSIAKSGYEAFVQEVEVNAEQGGPAEVPSVTLVRAAGPGSVMPLAIAAIAVIAAISVAFLMIRRRSTR